MLDVEREDLRTEYTKTYQDGTNPAKFKLSVGQSRKHWNDKGVWKEYDYTPRVETDGKYFDGVPYDLWMSNNQVSFKLTKTDGTWYKLTLIDVNGVVPIVPESVWDGGKFVYKDVGGVGLDFAIQTTPHKIELWKIINSGTTPLNWKLELETNDSDWQLETSNIWSAYDSSKTINPVKLTRSVITDVTTTTRKLIFRETVDLLTYITDKSWAGPPEGKGATKNRKWSGIPKYPIYVDVNINVDVSQSEDDCWEEDYSNLVNLSGSTILMGVHASDGRNAGFRFQNVDIPDSVTIDDATLNLERVTMNGTGAGVWYGDDRSDPTEAWSNSNRPEQVTKTTASDTMVTGSSDGQVPQDVKSIIVEIAALGSNGDIRIVGIGSGTGYNNISWESWDSSGTNEPNLDINYTTSGLTITPSGIASVEAFGASTITTGNVNITPTGIASAEGFGTAKFILYLIANAIASAEAFGSTVLTTGNVNITPNGIVSAENFGSATITTGAVIITPSGIVSIETHGASSIQVGNVNVSPAGIGSNEAFGAHTINLGGIILTPNGIASLEAFGTLVFQMGAVSIGPISITSLENFGTTVLQPGAVIILPNGISSIGAFGSSLIVAGAVIINPTGIASSGSFGTAIIVGGSVLIGWLEATIKTYPALDADVKTYESLDAAIKSYVALDAEIKVKPN